MGWDRPQEDEFALCNMGVPSPYWSIAFPNQPPQAEEYFELDRLGPAQRRRWQQALADVSEAADVEAAAAGIVLKSPPHTFRLPILREMFPDARFIHVVRNPYVVFPSTVRLWKSLYALNSYQEPTCAGLEEQVLATFSRMHERLEATRGLIAPRRFCEVRYEDLIAGSRWPPCGQIYEQLELGGFEQVAPAIGRYFQDRADYQTNRYELTPEQRSGSAAAGGRISRSMDTKIRRRAEGGRGKDNGRAPSPPAASGGSQGKQRRSPLPFPPDAASGLGEQEQRLLLRTFRLPPSAFRLRSSFLSACQRRPLSGSKAVSQPSP